MNEKNANDNKSSVFGYFLFRGDFGRNWFSWWDCSFNRNIWRKKILEECGIDDFKTMNEYKVYECMESKWDIWKVKPKYKAQTAQKTSI